MTPAPPPTDRPIVALTGVTKQFASGTRALDGLDLAIANGEFVSLLGPSRCGKSTALRLIAGLGEPSTRAISWNGTRPGARRNGVEARFGVQGPTVIPWTTVANNKQVPTRAPAVA